MKIYLDACCLNRPFDDQSQARIRVESEIIIFILSRIYEKEWEWIGSFLQQFEQGEGDYSKERHHSLEKQTVTELIDKIHRRRESE